MASLLEIADSLDKLSQVVSDGEETAGFDSSFWSNAATVIRMYSAERPRGLFQGVSMMKCAFVLKMLDDAAWRLADQRVNAVVDKNVDEAHLLSLFEELIHRRLEGLCIPLVAPNPYRSSIQMAKMYPNLANVIQAIRGWKSRFPHLQPCKRGGFREVDPESSFIPIGDTVRCDQCGGIIYAHSTSDERSHLITYTCDRCGLYWGWGRKTQFKGEILRRLCAGTTTDGKSCCALALKYSRFCRWHQA